MSDNIQLNAEQIKALLEDLTQRMAARGINGHIRIAGGAAMALRYPNERVRLTSDIDALYEPRPDIDAIIVEMADQYRLPRNWMNSNGAAWIRVAQSDNTVSVATNRELAAMKLAAGRAQDIYDLRIIAKDLGISNATELVDIAYEIYGEDSIELPDGRSSYEALAVDAVIRPQPQPSTRTPKSEPIESTPPSEDNPGREPEF
ncbi:MAG TPA: hypothetical protein VFU07_05050 [Candidatus Lumbricidophila sp.]|nr:hypothetical protein [Candidatus Lumbricidophila sp.]